MPSLSRLRAALVAALSPGGFERGELFDQLVTHTQHLLNLFDFGPRSSQEQRELESGKTLVNGKSLAVNNDFKRQALFISQHLDCSERYAAELLHGIMLHNPNIVPLDCIEATILEFHNRRRQLADCLRFLFEAAVQAQSPDPFPWHSQIEAYVRQQIVPLSAASGKAQLSHRILLQLQSLDQQLAKIFSAKQNATSNTQVVAGNIALGQEVLKAQYDSIKYERRNLAFAYYLMARAGYLTPQDIEKTVDWLSSNHRHPMTYYLLSATLAAFDPASPETFSGEMRKMLAMNKDLVALMKKKLDVGNTEWKDIGLKATVLLKWTLFLTEARHRDPSLEHSDGFKTEQLETQIWNAVQGDTFTYLARSITLLNKRRGSHISSSSLTSPIQLVEQESVEPPAEDFKPSVLEAFETLIRSLLTHASSELRKIKQRQEDFLLASVRNDRSRMFRSAAPSPATPSVGSDGEKHPRNDVATLLSFIGLLYSSLTPERALQFWGAAPRGPMTYLEKLEATSGKLPAFLQWAVWSTQVRDVDMSTALYDMLSGLSQGQQCSELCYNFLAKGGGEVIPGSTLPSSGSSSSPSISIHFIFGTLDAWASAAANQPIPQSSSTSQYGWASQQASSHSRHLNLNEKDVRLAQAFLGLLSTITAHSVSVRVAISGHAQFRAIPTLVSLIPLGIPLELKGAVFTTLASFCEPGAGTSGVEICKAVWSLMEKLEVINVRTSGGIGMAMVKGVEVELEEVETVHKMYPATIPFLKLLSTLIHTPKRVPLKDRFMEVEPLNNIPDALGQPYRLPGIGPFISFVVVNVFSKISSREYARSYDRWQMNDLCLCFIERCLASYDLESLVNPIEELQDKGESIVPLLVHPGYDIMNRILSSTSLQTSLLAYIVEGIEGLDNGLAEEEYYFQTTMIRVLRIILRVLEIQDIFLDVLIPTLSEFNSTQFVGIAHSRSYYTRFDQALSFGPQYVPAIVSYILYPQYPELALLSVKILSSLVSSTTITNLTTLIERSYESDRILAGYQRTMDAETLEDVVQAETTTEQSTGAGAPDLERPPDSIIQGTKLAILDLFLRNTRSNCAFPNVAHFLLLGSMTSDQQIQDPHALGARRNCIHTILDALNTGIPQWKGKDRARNQQFDPLFCVLPGLAERCYMVIQQLCEHPKTSDFTMRYLRTRENFFVRHLAAIPFRAPSVHDDPFIEVLYNDESRVATTVDALSAFLRLRSSIFSLVALELHILTAKGHNKSFNQLLELLFGNDDGYVEDGNWEDMLFRPFQEVGQSHLRIIEFLHSLDFDWSDSLTVHQVPLELLQLNLQACTRIDESGCEVIDRTALLSLLAIARRALYAQGRLVTPAHVEHLKSETTYILESCAIENHRRKVQHAVLTGYQAWRSMLDMALVKCFGRLPHERRENMLFDLLHALPTVLRSQNTEQPTAILLSEVILSSITKLREDRQHQVVIQSADSDMDGGSLPSERLYTLLRGILECILDSNRNQFVRGNLYATLINYFNLISSNEVAQNPPENPASVQGPLSLSTSMSRDDFVFSESQLSLSTRQNSTSLVSGSLAVMRNVTERLVGIIARDAIDGMEVWKTIAFMTLDSLTRAFRSEKQSPILSALIRHGILSNFVQGLKESDLRFQNVLKPDPDDLNSLYVYETKMSLLIQMSRKRPGAERLLESQIIPILTQCDYLDARPEIDQAFMDHDNLLPSAIQRYHQLFMPALQLINGILMSLGSKHISATTQIFEFVSSHRDTLVILLKTEMDEIPLSLLDETHLIVTLCSSVLSLVPKSELFSTSGYGGIHSAILTLAARCLGNKSWTDNVRPQTDVELSDATAYVPGAGNETRFRMHVRRRDMALRKSLAFYLGSASSFTEPEISLVLSPVISTARHEERGIRFSATVPSVGDTVEALNDLCTDLAATLKKIADLSVELSSRDHIRVNNILEIVDVANIDILQDLDIGQKRALICRELTKLLQEARSEAQNWLATVELLLLLLWRHLAYYTDERRTSSTQTKASTPQVARLVASLDVNAFRTDVPKKLSSVLQKLEALDLNKEMSVDEDWRFNHAYIDIMCRRLRDTFGLPDPSGPDERLEA